jgi:hypothetical protein
MTDRCFQNTKKRYSTAFVVGEGKGRVLRVCTYRGADWVALGEI